MSDKRPSSTKARRDCFDANKRMDESGRVYLECHICCGRIDPARDPWDAEHVIPHAFGGKVLMPAHVKCHKGKTADDVGRIAKSKRVSDNHFGIKRKGWGGKYRKKLNGEVVER